MRTIQGLLAEDNGDVYLVHEVLREHRLEYQMQVLPDGLEVERYLERLIDHPDTPCPDVFLLDLNLPKAELLGATIYFRKPSDLTEFMNLGAIVSQVVNQSRDGRRSDTSLRQRTV